MMSMLHYIFVTYDICVGWYLCYLYDIYVASNVDNNVDTVQFFLSCESSFTFTFTDTSTPTNRNNKCKILQREGMSNKT